MLDKNWFSEIDLHRVMTGIFDPIVALVNTVIIFDAVLIAAFIVIVGFVVIVSILAVVCGGFGEIIARVRYGPLRVNIPYRSVHV